MTKRFAAVARVAAVTALLAACGATGTPVDPAPVSPEAPLPVGVVQNPTATATSGAPVPQCPADGRASFRPGALPAPGQLPAGSTMDRIKQNGLLKAGVDQNTFLFGFRNPSTNQLEGFDIDRVHEIAAAIFGDPTKVQFKVLTSAQRIPALQNGDVDVVVRTFTANCDRWSKIDFSRIYYVAHQRLLVDRSSDIDSLERLAGKRVCAQQGSTSISNLAQRAPNATRVATNTWSDCLVMLQQHQVDAVSTDDVILSGLAAQDPNVKLSGAALTDEPYGIGIPQGKEDLARFVNAVLEKSIRDGSWAKSYDKWVGSRTGESASPPPAEYRD
ncbi:MAG: transporter substrate-binding domain-containing protein [Labedaea sp.]